MAGCKDWDERAWASVGKLAPAALPLKAVPRGRAAVAMTMAALLCVLAAGSACAHVKEVGDKPFKLSSRDARLAEGYEQEDLQAADGKKRCAYWKQRQQFVERLVWADEAAHGLGEWAQAKLEQACGVKVLEAEREQAKRAEIEQQEARQRAERERVAAKAAADAAALEQQKAAEQEQARQDAEQAAVRAATRAEEVKTKRCTQEHHSQLQQAMRLTQETLDTRRDWEAETRGTSYFSLLAHDILVATPQGTPFQFSAGVGGDMHVFAFAEGSVELQIRDAKGFELTEKSEWSRILRFSNLNDDGRAFQANAGESYSIGVKGTGCALVLVFRRM